MPSINSASQWNSANHGAAEPIDRLQFTMLRRAWLPHGTWRHHHYWTTYLGLASKRRRRSQQGGCLAPGGADKIVQRCGFSLST